MYAQATCKSLANMPACSLRLCPESPPLRPETGLWPVSTVTSFATVDLRCLADKKKAGLLEVVGAHELFKLGSNGTVRGLRKCTSGEGAAVNASSHSAIPQTTSQSQSPPANVGPGLVSGAAIQPFSGKIMEAPPIDEGGPQLCEVRGPGMNGGGPGGQRPKLVLNNKLRVFWCPALYNIC